MLNLQIISTIVGIFMGIGVFVAGCGYTYSSWKASKEKYKDGIIADLKDSLALEQEKVHRLNTEKTILMTSHQTQLTEMQKELAELRGKFEEQSKKLTEYRDLLQNRDPATLKMLTEIKDAVVKLNDHGVASTNVNVGKV